MSEAEAAVILKSKVAGEFQDKLLTILYDFLSVINSLLLFLNVNVVLELLTKTTAPEASTYCGITALPKLSCSEIVVIPALLEVAPTIVPLGI